MAEEIGIVEVRRLKVVRADAGTFGQIFRPVLVVLLVQLRPVAKVDPLPAAALCVARDGKKRRAETETEVGVLVYREVGKFGFWEGEDAHLSPKKK